MTEIIPKLEYVTIKRSEYDALYGNADFLCARLRDLEGFDGDELLRQLMGHVLPALARLESTLTKARGGMEYDYLRAVVEGGERGQPIDPWKPDPDDPFWMLEVRQGFDEAGSWLKNDQTYLTTREPTKALRYPSRFAADCARSRLPLSESARFEPTDHLWIRPLPESPRGDNG